MFLEQHPNIHPVLILFVFNVVTPGPSNRLPDSGNWGRPITNVMLVLQVNVGVYYKSIRSRYKSTKISPTT